MVKIAVIGSRNLPADYGGIEKACEQLYALLAKKGHIITFYCRNKRNTYEKTEYKGIKVINLPTIELVGMGTFFQCFIASILASFSDAEIIHYHAQGPAFFSFIPKLLAPKKKIGFTCHGIDWQRDKWTGIAKKIIKQGEVHSAKYTDFRIMVSSGLGERYTKVYGVDWTRIPNAVNLPERKVELEILKEKFGLEKNKYIIFVGRLVPEKAPDLLIKAFKSLNSAIKLVFAGDSPDTPEYVKKLHDLAEDDDRIIFTSYLRGKSLEELFSNALAYISPSKLEGNPLTGLEAMSYNLPVLLSDIQPHEEMLSYDKSAGISFETNNINACQNAMENLFKANVKIMGQKTYEIVENHFSWDKIAEETEQLYLDIIYRF